MTCIYVKVLGLYFIIVKEPGKISGKEIIGLHLERVFWQKYARLRMDMKRLEAEGFVKTLLKDKG